MEDAGGLELRLDDEAEPAMVEGQAFVLEHPSGGMALQVSA
jgi:hypothetical protein